MSPLAFLPLDRRRPSRLPRSILVGVVRRLAQKTDLVGYGSANMNLGPENRTPLDLPSRPCYVCNRGYYTVSPKEF